MSHSRSKGSIVWDLMNFRNLFPCRLHELCTLPCVLHGVVECNFCTHTHTHKIAIIMQQFLLDSRFIICIIIVYLLIIDCNSFMGSCQGLAPIRIIISKIDYFLFIFVTW